MIPEEKSCDFTGEVVRKPSLGGLLEGVNLSNTLDIASQQPLNRVQNNSSSSSSSQLLNRVNNNAVQAPIVAQQQPPPVASNPGPSVSEKGLNPAPVTRSKSNNRQLPSSRNYGASAQGDALDALYLKNQYQGPQSLNTHNNLPSSYQGRRENNNIPASKPYHARQYAGSQAGGYVPQTGHQIAGLGGYNNQNGNGGGHHGNNLAVANSIAQAYYNNRDQPHHVQLKSGGQGSYISHRYAQSKVTASLKPLDHERVKKQRSYGTQAVSTGRRVMEKK